MEKVTYSQTSEELGSSYVYHHLLSDFTKYSGLINSSESEEYKLKIHELEIGVLLGMLNNGNVRKAIREIIRVPEGPIRGWLEKIVVQAGVIADLSTTPDVEEIRIATPHERKATRADFFVNGRPVICRKDQSSPPKYAFYSELLNNTVPARAKIYKLIPKHCINAYAKCMEETKQYPLIIVAPYARVYYGDTHLYIN